MRFLRYRLGVVAAGALVLVALLSLPALASNGKVAGQVLDNEGNPLPSASVVTKVGARKVGANTDEQGRYFLLNLPPGVYEVEASYVGHQTVRQTEVQVRLDLTTELDFELMVEAIEGEGVTVVAERPLIEPSLTTSRSTLGSAEIDNTMPVSDLQDLINTTPSSFRGYIRGGRKGDAKILVDGIDVSDAYFRAGEGRSVYSPYAAVQRSTGGEFGSVGVNASSVQALDIIAGTFNAEYDAATSGVINVTTKEGGEKVRGRVFFRMASGVKNAGPDVYANKSSDCEPGNPCTDLEKYFAERDALLNSVDDAGNPVADDVKKGQLYTFTRDTIDEIGYGDDPRYEAEVSVGGPLTSKGGFFFTGRFLNDHGLFVNALNRSARYSLKLTHAPTQDVKVTGNLMIDDGGKLGGWTNRDFSGRFKFYPEGAIANKKLGVMAYVGVSHALSPQTVYEVKISQLNRTSEFGFADDNGDGRSDLDEDGDFIILDTAAETEKYLGVGGSGVDANGNLTFFTPDPGNEKYFTLGFSDNQYRFGQPGFYYEELKRNVSQLKADITHQLNFNHQLKAGLLYRYHSLEQFQQRTQVKVIYDQNFPFENTQYELNPSEMAVYVQDRIEYEGVVINAGVRLDGFDSGAEGLGDYFRPSYQDTLASGQIVRKARLGSEIDTKWFLQPRLGISHPITDNAAMYYSWGKFYTPSSFSDLFDEYGTFANPSLPNIVDPGRDPSEATAYEIGLQYALSQEYLVGVTAYYRDIANYSSIGYSINPDPAANAGFGSYIYSTSFGYADSRGFEVSLERRTLGRISGRINYAYSYIKASGGAGDTSPYPDRTSYSFAAGDTELPLDDRYTFNTVESNVNGGDNPLLSGFDRTHRISLALLAQLPYAVDVSLISQVQSGFFYRVTETSDDPRQREVARAPWSSTTDVRLTRGFAFGEDLKTNLFLEATNLFDGKNIIAYDNSTNSSRKNWEEDEDPTGDLNRAYSGASQPFYDPPRQISLGLSVDF